MGTSISFIPTTGFDTLLKNGQTGKIVTHTQCITAMMVYSNKSLEELRFEDYQLGRRGPKDGKGTCLHRFEPVRWSEMAINSGDHVIMNCMMHSITTMQEYKHSSFEELRLEDYREGRGPKFNPIAERCGSIFDKVFQPVSQQQGEKVYCNLINNLNITLPSVHILGAPSQQRQLINPKRRLQHNFKTTSSATSSPLKLKSGVLNKSLDTVMSTVAQISNFDTNNHFVKAIVDINSNDDVGGKLSDKDNVHGRYDSDDDTEMAIANKTVVEARENNSTSGVEKVNYSSSDEVKINNVSEHNTMLEEKIGVSRNSETILTNVSRTSSPNTMKSQKNTLIRSKNNSKNVNCSDDNDTFLTNSKASSSHDSEYKFKNNNDVKGTKPDTEQYVHLTQANDCKKASDITKVLGDCTTKIYEPHCETDSQTSNAENSVVNQESIKINSNKKIQIQLNRENINKWSDFTFLNEDDDDYNEESYEEALKFEIELAEDNAILLGLEQEQLRRSLPSNVDQNNTIEDDTINRIIMETKNIFHFNAAPKPRMIVRPSKLQNIVSPKTQKSKTALPKSIFSGYPFMNPNSENRFNFDKDTDLGKKAILDAHLELFANKPQEPDAVVNNNVSPSPTARYIRKFTPFSFQEPIPSAKSTSSPFFRVNFAEKRTTPQSNIFNSVKESPTSVFNTNPSTASSSIFSTPPVIKPATFPPNNNLNSSSISSTISNTSAFNTESIKSPSLTVKPATGFNTASSFNSNFGVDIVNFGASTSKQCTVIESSSSKGDIAPSFKHLSVSNEMDSGNLSNPTAMQSKRANSGELTKTKSPDCMSVDEQNTENESDKTNATESNVSRSNLSMETNATQSNDARSNLSMENNATQSNVSRSNLLMKNNATQSNVSRSNLSRETNATQSNDSRSNLSMETNATQSNDARSNLSMDTNTTQSNVSRSNRSMETNAPQSNESRSNPSTETKSESASSVSAFKGASVPSMFKGKGILKKSCLVKSSVPSNTPILESNKPSLNSLSITPQKESSGGSGATKATEVTTSASSSAIVVKNPFYLGSNEGSPIKKKIVARSQHFKPQFKLTKSKLALPAFDFSEAATVSVNLSFDATNAQPGFGSSLSAVGVPETRQLPIPSASNSASPCVQTVSSTLDESSSQSLPSVFQNIESLSDSLSQTMNSHSPLAQASNVSIPTSSSQTMQHQNTSAPISHSPTFSFFDEFDASINDTLPSSNRTSILDIFNAETYYPLILHREKHRYGDMIFNNELVTDASHHPRNLYFFSAIPVIINQIFALKVRELFNSTKNDVIIGFTAVDPSGLNVLQLPDPMRLVDRLEYWVFETFKLQTNDEIKFQLKTSGDVEFYKNFRYTTSYFVDTTINLWLFVYIKNGVRSFSLKTNERTDLSVIEAMNRPVEQIDINPPIDLGMRPNNENILENNRLWNFRLPSVDVRRPVRRNVCSYQHENNNDLRRRYVNNTAEQHQSGLRLQALLQLAQQPVYSDDDIYDDIHYEMDDEPMSDVINRNSIPFSNVTLPTSMNVMDPQRVLNLRMNYNWGVNRSNSVQSSPVQSSPVQSSPVQSSPVQSSPDQSRSASPSREPMEVAKSIFLSKPDKPTLKKPDRENECIICCDQVINCVLYKCGHSCMCLDCAVSIVRQGDVNCPICRKTISDVIKIFKP